MHERGGLERVVGLLAAHPGVRDVPEFVVDQRHEAFECAVVAGAPRVQ
jgi:hypothetical protein